MSIPLNSPFTEVKEPEIHTIRRAKIIQQHPEIKNLMGYDSWSGLLTILLVFLQLTFAYYCSTWWYNADNWWRFLLTSYCIGAVMNHWVGMAIHEASHNLLAPTVQQNKWLSIFANIPILLPVSIAFRRHHLRHHSHLGIEEMDNDFPSHWEVKWIGNSTLFKFIWLFFYVFFATMARGFGEKPSRWEWINIVVIITTDILIFYYLGWGGISYLLLSTFFGYSLHPVAGHFIHEHFIFTDGQETNSYYGLLNSVCFNVGYHNEHHDFMNIPGRRLPAYYNITESFYKDLDSSSSWTYTLLHFIFSKQMHTNQRYTRTESVRKSGIQQAQKIHYQAKEH